jgi:hypothetical protein
LGVGYELYGVCQIEATFGFYHIRELAHHIPIFPVEGEFYFCFVVFEFLGAHCWLSHLVF